MASRYSFKVHSFESDARVNKRRFSSKSRSPPKELYSAYFSCKPNDFQNF